MSRHEQRPSYQSILRAWFEKVGHWVLVSQKKLAYSMHSLKWEKQFILQIPHVWTVWKARDSDDHDPSPANAYIEAFPVRGWFDETAIIQSVYVRSLSWPATKRFRMIRLGDGRNTLGWSSIGRFRRASSLEKRGPKPRFSSQWNQASTGAACNSNTLLTRSSMQPFLTIKAIEVLSPHSFAAWFISVQINSEVAPDVASHHAILCGGWNLPRSSPPAFVRNGSRKYFPFGIFLRTTTKHTT